MQEDKNEIPTSEPAGEPPCDPAGAFCPELCRTLRHKHEIPIDVPTLLTKPYLTEKEVSALTGRAVATLRNQRHLRKGFPYLKPKGGRAVRYKTADIIKEMEEVRIAFD